jgi:hypothetical protein
MTEERTLDVFIFCRSMKIEARWEKSAAGVLADGIDPRDDLIPNSLKIFIVRRMNV